MALMSEKEAEILKKHICEFYNMKSENEELRTMLSQCAADIQKIKRVNELFGADPDKDYIHMGKIEKLLNKDYSDAHTNTDYIWRKLQENKKLKAMLKTALSVINSLCYCGSDNCHYCAYVNDYYACNDSDGFKWAHDDEIKKLLDEEYSDSDSAAVEEGEK